MRLPAIGLLATVAIAGCASKPHHTQSAPPLAAQNEAAPHAAATPVSASEASRDAKLASKYPPGVNLDLIKQGYAVAEKDGGFVYCRKDAVTGSRFTQRVCLTESQIKENEARAKEALRDMNNGVCSGKMCNN
jgi:hypothetical protein